MIEQSYRNTAQRILDSYDGSEPFHLFLKSYFKQNKKHGSRDRKQIAELCYAHFRSLLFKWVDELSDGIDVELFLESFKIQPDVFLRIRPGFESIVPKKLSDAELQFRIVNPHCLALRSASKIEEAIEIDKEAVIQDLSSQRISEFFPSHVSRLTSHVWDCCAASGGKSILAYDILKNIKLLVTDLRESILVNLRKRFAAAGIQNYKAQVIDLSTTQLLNNSTTQQLNNSTIQRLTSRLLPLPDYV